MIMHKYPILEFDPSQEAILEPNDFASPIEIPNSCVLATVHHPIPEFNMKNCKIIASISTEMGQHPIYQIEYNGKAVAIFNPGIGAPLAAGFMEELIVYGCRKFIACGGAGALYPEYARGKIIVPTSAVRDEGTSYHYLPPSREVEADREVVKTIEEVLNRNKIDYVSGKTWTTDGLYRETREKAQRRRKEGCLAVEMEAAALFAVAKFRGIPFGQILFGDDTLGKHKWTRGMFKDAKYLIESQVINLAIETCIELQLA